MNFFQRIFNAFTDAQYISAPKQDVLLNAATYGSFTTVNGDFSISQAELISTVYTCINILSSNTSRLPLLVFKDDGVNKTVYKDHPRYAQIRFKPTNYYSYQNWMSLIVSHLYFEGNAYALIGDEELTIVNPQEVEVAFYKNKIWYDVKGFSQPFTSDEVLHWKLLSKNGIKGLNPIKSLKSELNIQYKAERTVDSFFTNNAAPSLYLKSDIQGIGAGDKEIIKEKVDQWEREGGAYDNRGKIKVIPPGYDIKEVKVSAEDIAFLEAANYTESSISSLFGIPTFLLGKSNSNYTNFEQQQLNFKNQVLGSLLSIIRAELESKLLSIEEKVNGITIEFDLMALMETDLLTRANVAKTLNSMAAQTPNEVRRSFNLPYVQKKEMNEYYHQSQNVPVGQGGKQAVAVLKDSDT